MAIFAVKTEYDFPFQELSLLGENILIVKLLSFFSMQIFYCMHMV